MLDGQLLIVVPLEGLLGSVVGQSLVVIPLDHLLGLLALQLALVRPVPVVLPVTHLHRLPQLVEHRLQVLVVRLLLKTQLLHVVQVLHELHRQVLA